MKILIILLIFINYSCARNNENDTSKKIRYAIVEKKKDSLIENRQLTIAEQMALGSGNGDNLPPSYEEEKVKLIDQYDKVINKDTVFIIRGDKLRFSFKYYCLKEKSLIIPKKFAFGSKRPRDFSTFDFAANIVLSKGGDTLTSEVIKKAKFSAFLNYNLNNFGTLRSPSITFNDKNQILVRFGVGIPLTDLTNNVYLIINEDGSTFVRGQ